MTYYVISLVKDSTKEYQHISSVINPMKYTSILRSLLIFKDAFPMNDEALRKIIKIHQAPYEKRFNTQLGFGWKKIEIK